MDQSEILALLVLGHSSSTADGAAGAQLDEYANRFASLLRSLGLQTGDVLGIHLPNTPQYVVALVGAAKAGVVVSGVSPLLTPPEITHQVNDAHVKVLLTLDRLYASAVAPARRRL